MVIKDKEITELVSEQRDYFLSDAPPDKKIEVFKRILKRQKQLMKGKKEDD